MNFAATQDRLNAVALKRFGEQHLLAGVPVQGDFVKPGKKFTIGDGVEIEATTPLLVVSSVELPDAWDGATAVCEGETYTVQDARPDGHGLWVVYLQKGI